MAKVVVGLSGGVDSSVAAALLIEQGHEVIGVFMKNWHDSEVTISDDCPWEEDSNDALVVAEKLGIPFQTLDLSETYKKRIVDYMFREYEAGRTPNPDVLCNREIKFDVFLEAALSLGADFVATGHYCQKNETTLDGKIIYHLIAGADQSKDQSYFLCQVNQHQLSRALFPIGHLEKKEVRKIAEEKGLITANKKDSQGLCFIGKVRLPDFLQQQLKPKPGNIVEIAENSEIYQNHTDTFLPYDYSETDGKIVGKHQGAHFYTIGQRKGLGVGGKVEPLFVIATNVDTNTIYVGMGENHPGLLRLGLKIENSEIHWVRPDLSLSSGNKMSVLCRIRYRQDLQKATLFKNDYDLKITFDEPQRAIAPGQFAAWYLGDELIGSGVIS
ncbi:MAG: tRNA 2-thiouridine(34) synthase MnmA [Flavobacteriales bacterium]|nr:tRNA 2-thiouridine(34) synthase MnmA [Flavobacteriales bacterium]